MFFLDPSPLAGTPHSQAVVGGPACWPTDLPWPTSADGVPMRPLLTLHEALFLIPTLPTGHVVTVFAPHHPGRHNADLRACALHCNQRLPPLRRGQWQEPPNDADDGLSGDGLRVLLHPQAPWQVHGDTWPALQLTRRAATDAELREEQAGDYEGLDASKLFGRARWLQDPIYEHNSQHFILQLRERDLAQVDSAYDGLWNDGTLYLVLNHGLRHPNGALRWPVGLCGRAFVQFS